MKLSLAMSKWEDMVQVEVYVKGKGPLYRLKVPLQGYEKKQIDLEALMVKCRLQNVYAYSITAGRGIQQLYNPRNGLSKVSYSGKPDSIIRLDGDPKPTVSSLVGRYLFAAVMVALLIVGTTTSQADWVVKVQELGGGRIAWLGCFVVMVVTQLAWKPFKRRS